METCRRNTVRRRVLSLHKTVRKYFGEAIVVTQEVEDIISSPIVKESIINNADCKILLDQRKYRNKFDQIQTLLGLTDKERAQVLSINLSNDPARRYKEVFISLGGVQSAVYATEVSDEEYLVRPYKLLSKYPTGKGLGKCSLKNLSSPDLSERETGRGV